MYTLVGSESSPYVRKVRMAVKILGIDDQVTLQPSNTRDPEDPIRGINPLGKIPALIDPDGAAIFDSRVIIEYLDTRYGNGAVIPRDPDARARTLTRAALAEGMIDALLLIVYEGRYREPEQASDVWLDLQFGKVRRGLDAVLADIGAYSGNSVAAITLACALGYIDFRKQLDWREEFPDLVAWLDAFAAAGPAFNATKPVE